jgi:hypothetical protein
MVLAGLFIPDAGSIGTAANRDDAQIFLMPSAKFMPQVGRRAVRITAREISNSKNAKHSNSNGRAVTEIWGEHCSLVAWSIQTSWLSIALSPLRRANRSRAPPTV